MIRIRWTLPAADDLKDIKRYLDMHYPKFSCSTVRKLYDVSAHSRPCPNGAESASSPAREKSSFIHFRASWFTGFTLRPLKFCGSTTEHRIEPSVSPRLRPVSGVPVASCVALSSVTAGVKTLAKAWKHYFLANCYATWH